MVKMIRNDVAYVVCKLHDAFICVSECFFNNISRLTNNYIFLVEREQILLRRTTFFAKENERVIGGKKYV